MNSKFEIKKIKIRDILEDKNLYNLDLPYQRNDDAWGNKQKELLIDSLKNNYLIPPIIINKKHNNLFDVLDGKQRLTTIFNWKKDGKDNELLDSELFFIEIDNEKECKLKETFLRINTNSIKLNKDELLLSKCSKEIKDFIIDIAKDENFKRICEKNKKDKRLTREGLLLWNFTIILNLNKPNTTKSSIRNLMEKIVTNEISMDIKKDDVVKTFKLIFETIGKDVLESKNFKTAFTSIFISFYLNISSYTLIYSNKESICEEIKNILEEIKNDQMGGGTKYDSLLHIRRRIDKIKLILENYISNDGRNFKYDDVVKKMKEQDNKCANCGTLLINNNYHRDHIQPYSKGGSSTIENLQLLCPHCNQTKSNKY